MHPWAERLYARSPVALQNAYVSWYGGRIRRQRFTAAYDRWMELFERSQWWSDEELGAYQDERIAAMVRHCYESVPFYRRSMEARRLRPSDVTRRADLPKLPIVTKEMIRSEPDAFLDARVRSRDLKASPTSGTTGSSFTVLWDRDTDVLWNAVLWRHRSWSGFGFGARYATLLGRMIVPLERMRPPYWRWNLPWNQLLFSSFHLRSETVEPYLEALQRYDITALECYPSTGYILARLLEDRGARIALRHVVTSSETLLPIQREVMERCFGSRVHDYYGMSEAVLFAGECGSGSGYHLHSEIGVPEIVDERGEPLPAGRHGRLLGTGLVNRAMPLLRYEIGDISALRSERCACGRGLPLLDPVTSKAEDIVVAPDGRLISPSALTHPFKPLDRVEKSQIIQESRTRLRIRIVPRPGFGTAETEHLVREMKRRLGHDMEIDVEVVDEIPLGATGKYRWVVSRLPLEFRRQSIANLFGEDRETGAR